MGTETSFQTRQVSTGANKLAHAESQLFDRIDNRDPNNLRDSTASAYDNSLTLMSHLTDQLQRGGGSATSSIGGSKQLVTANNASINKFSSPNQPKYHDARQVEAVRNPSQLALEWRNMYTQHSV